MALFDDPFLVLWTEALDYLALLGLIASYLSPGIKRAGILLFLFISSGGLYGSCLGAT
jgi:hypothetical protein